MTAPNNKPVPDEIIARFRAYGRKHPEWKSLHIVLSGGNVKDDHCRFCVDYAKAHGDKEGVFLAGELLKMSKSQRHKMARVQS